MTKKRIIAFVSVLMIMVSLMSSFTYAEEPEISQRAINSDFIAAYSVKLRESATTVSDVVVTAPKRSTLNHYNTVNWSHSVTSWSDVHYGSYYGYVRNDLICPSHSCYKVTASSGLNLRASGSSSASSYGTINNGEYVYLITYSNNWAKVIPFSSNSSVDGVTGYVSMTYLTKITGI